MAPKRQYYPELDGIRAFAALLIMTFHAVQLGMPVPGPISFAQTGVDLFFVLSGFLITSILLVARQHDWDEVKTFYLRRALRIFPLYYGYLIASVLLGSAIGWPFWVYLQNFWFSGGHPIAGPNHFWSLAIEEQFYLVWPFVVLFGPRKHLQALLWTVVGGAAVVRMFFALHGHDVFSHTLTRADALAAGAILAVWSNRESLQRKARLLMAGAVVFGVLMVGVGLTARQSGAVWFTTVKYDLIEGFYMCLLGVVLVGRLPRVNALLRTKVLRFIGRISYGLYVFHPVVFAWTFVRLRGYSWWVRGSAGYTIVFSVSLLSWYAYERNFIKLKDKVAPERRFTPRAPINV